MHLIVCVEDRYGLSFCGRRLSSDCKVTEHILKTTSGAKLWMNAYSAKLFPKGSVWVAEDFLHKAQEGEYCFAETTPLAEPIPVESVTVYHWNRKYPSTDKFPCSLLFGLHLECREDFPGNSHESITVERYVL